MSATEKLQINQCNPGMILAEPVFHPVTMQQLIPAGTVLSPHNLSMLFRAGVPLLTVLTFEESLPPIPLEAAETTPVEAPLPRPVPRPAFPKAATGPLRRGTGPLGNLFAAKEGDRSWRYEDPKVTKFSQNELEVMAKEVVNRNNDMVHSMEATFRQTAKVDFEAADTCVQNTIQEIILNKELLTNLCDLRVYDEYTYSHCSNVMSLAMVIGYTMGYPLDRLRVLGVAALMHDLGKNLIPDFILRKPGKLTDQEFDVMKTHPEKGVQILSAYKWATNEIKAAVLYHHEKVNGTGYPKRLPGKDIPEMAKIIAIADVYDALVSDRPYKTAMPPNLAYQIIMDGFNSHFEGRIVWAFQRFIVPFPVNALVILNSGEIAKVIKVNRENLAKPVVDLDGQAIDLMTHPRLAITNIYRPQRPAPNA